MDQPQLASDTSGYWGTMHHGSFGGSVRAAEGETNTKGVHDKEHMGGVEKERDILETRTLYVIYANTKSHPFYFSIYQEKHLLTASAYFSHMIYRTIHHRHHSSVIPEKEEEISNTKEISC